MTVTCVNAGQSSSGEVVSTGHPSGGAAAVGARPANEVHGADTDRTSTFGGSSSGVANRNVGAMSRRTLSRSLAATSTQPDCSNGLGITFWLHEIQFRSRVSW